MTDCLSIAWKEQLTVFTIEHGDKINNALKRSICSISLADDYRLMMPIVLPMVGFPRDLWSALIGVQEGKGIWFDHGTKFYDTNGFFWPQSSLIILKPGQRLSGYRLCFSITPGQQQKLNNKTSQASNVSLFAFAISKGYAHLTSDEWRNLRSTLGFVYHPIPLSSPGEFFSQDSCGCVWGV